MKAYTKEVIGMRSEDSTDKVKCEVFNSLNEMLDVCLDRNVKKGGFEDHLGGHDWNSSWIGCKYSDFNKFIREGWSEKVGDVKAVFKQADKTIPQEKGHKWVQSVAGVVPIVPRALMGCPDAMLSQACKPVKSKIVDICYMFNFSCGVSSEQVMKAGFELVKAVVSLEKRGYRVRLTTGGAFCNDGDIDLCLVHVKEESQPLDIKRIMFPMMHTAMWRGMIFGWYERCPMSKYKSGYGRALCHYANGDIGSEKILDGVLGDYCVYLDGSQVISKGMNYIKERLQSKNVRC